MAGSLLNIAVLGRSTKVLSTDISAPSPPPRLGLEWCQHFNTRGEWCPKDSLLPHPVWSMIQTPRSLTSFSDYLSRVRGLEPKSRDGVLLGARRFLVWVRHHHPGQDLKGLTAEQVLAAVEHQLSLSATSATRTAAVSHVRSFSPISALGWPPRPGSRSCCSKNASLAAGPFAAPAFEG